MIKFVNTGDGVDLEVGGQSVAHGRDKMEAVWHLLDIDPDEVPENVEEWMEDALPDVGGPTSEDIHASMLRGWEGR